MNIDFVKILGYRIYQKLAYIIINNIVFLTIYQLVCNDKDDWVGMDDDDDTTIDRFFNRLYYTVIVFSTIGFGDISPKSKKTKVLTIIHCLLNFFFEINLFINVV
mgnify:FL=1